MTTATERLTKLIDAMRQERPAGVRELDVNVVKKLRGWNANSAKRQGPDGADDASAARGGEK